MNEENNGNEEALETQGEATNPNEVVESVDDVREQLEKANELAKNYKIRAEKAEKRSDKSVKVEEVATQPQKGLSQSDLLAAMRSNIHEKDLPVVQQYATMTESSFSDALDNPIVKGILKDNEDKRKTSNASHTGNTAHKKAESSVENLVSKAKKGELPDSDTDLARLVEAQIQGRRKNSR